MSASKAVPYAPGRGRPTARYPHTDIGRGSPFLQPALCHTVGRRGYATKSLGLCWAGDGGHRARTIASRHRAFVKGGGKRREGGALFPAVFVSIEWTSFVAKSSFFFLQERWGERGAMHLPALTPPIIRLLAGLHAKKRGVTWESICQSGPIEIR